MWREPLARLCGGKTEQERRAALREYTEQAVRQGSIERPWDRLVAGMDYAAGGQAVSRFGKRLEQQDQLRRSLTDIETRLSNVEI